MHHLPVLTETMKLIMNISSKKIDEESFLYLKIKHLEVF